MSRPIEETLSEALRYDYESGKLFWKDDWYPKILKGREVGYHHYGNNSGTPYIRLEHRGSVFFAHRVIWLLHYGEWPDGEIDHIDGDGLNNRIDNLRVVSRQQNALNRGKYKTKNSSENPYKGVYPNKRGGKPWKSLICSKGRTKHIGLFSCPIEAARAYDRKAIELHGGYARTNFPIEDYLGA